jgi:2-amino-4-hydroxy-6-hydroxymethyldihydropteridine diphosphokinase
MESDADFSDEGLDSVIGLGANLGSPLVTLSRALGELRTLGELVAASALYRTAPVGGPPQPDFLNAAARLSFRGSALALLRCLRELERAAGRVRRERWGPRILDLDILWIKGLRLSTPRLTVPHPRLRQRAFALRPLVDVAADATDPIDGVHYRDVLAQLGSAGVEDLGTSWITSAVPGPAPGMDRPSS